MTKTENSKNKKIHAFTIDQDIDDFIERKRWDLKTSKSNLVNEALKYFKNHEEHLDKIFLESKKLLENEKHYKKMSNAINPYGDGKTNQRIVKILKNI